MRFACIARRLWCQDVQAHAHNPCENYTHHSMATTATLDWLGGLGIRLLLIRTSCTHMKPQLQFASVGLMARQLTLYGSERVHAFFVYVLAK